MPNKTEEKPVTSSASRSPSTPGSSAPNNASIGLIGDGRLARHLSHYLNLLAVPYRRWSRRQHAAGAANWSQSLKDCTVLMLAVSDRAIEPLAREIRQTSGFENCRIIHFSGALHTSAAFGYHPLMTFADQLYDLKTYQSIPFIVDEGAPRLKELLPRFQNPSTQIASDKKALYHAWCVMSGGFTAMLWGRMFESFKNDLELDPKVAIPYLERLSQNLFAHSDAPRMVWTGPHVRGDQTTIQSHLQALRNDSYQEVYRAFVDAYQKEKEVKP